MKLLMLTPRIPYPPTRGDVIRAWGELEFLAGRHDVWLACVDHVAPRAAQLDVLRSRCRDVVVATRSRAAAVARGAISLRRGRSFTEGYFDEPGLRARLVEWSACVGFDAVLTFSSAMAPHAEVVAASRRVLDMNDVDSDKWRRYAAHARGPLTWFYDLEARRLAQAERRRTRAHDITLLVNERERVKLVQHGGAARTAVVPTGVDLRRWGAIADSTLTADPVVLTVGSLSYPPNVRGVMWFARRVWPIVRSRRPDAQWWIVGSRPARCVRRLARCPGVTITGYVHDTRPHVKAARVFACPVHDEIGVQTKLIEALAAGMPCVATTAAARGLDGSVEPPLLSAGGPEDFAHAILRLFEDEELALSLRQRARAFASAHHDIDAQARAIERWLTGEPVDADFPYSMETDLAERIDDMQCRLEPVGVAR